MAGMDVRLFEQDHGFSVTMGLRIGNAAYSTDMVDLDEEAAAVLAGVDTWLLDCFQRQPHRTHCWFERTLELIRRIKPRRAVLTQLGPDMDWDWMIRRLPAGAEPAHDGMVIAV
jgi:phosphoribosyl 1,2-cyclic phosphate phosphodiesterase